MTAVFDGDPQPIYDIILDAEADEYVRSRMCEALAMLVLQDRLDRAEAAAFLRDCWRNLQPRGVCFVWNGWQSAIAMLGLTELREIVKEAFDREIIDPSWLSFHHFESDLELAVSDPTEPLPSHEDEFAPFGDTIEELSKWHCFSEKYRQDQEKLRDAPLPPFLGVLSEPIRNPLRGVGRNDPCPCGSGKKFKKCCLGKPSEGLRIAAKPGDSFLVDDVVDFDDADGPIQVYDPLVEPDPVEWLATGEQRRMDIVKHYHRAARSNAERSNAHAVVHTVVENQIAAGDELPVRRTLSRLMDEGLDRHQAFMRLVLCSPAISTSSCAR
jgi:hypothetical protein